MKRLSLGARNALELASVGRLTEPYRAPYEVVHRGSIAELRHYSGPNVEGVEALASEPEVAGPVLFVPPLMVTSEIYDIAPELSAVNYLRDHGVDTWLVDFGAPEHEEGGLARTFDDHIRAIDAAIDRVREATGRDPHLLGYSQGGMFCYQVAAFRRGEGIASLVTFGAPVDIHKNILQIDAGAAGSIIRGLRAAIETPLDRIEALPGFVTSTGFKVLSWRKELEQMADFLGKLHDRKALARREGRRRFLAGEGFVAWPAPALRTFIDEFIVHNRMLSGGFVIDGRTVTLADIRCPVLAFIGSRDILAQPPSVRAIRDAAPDAEVHEVFMRAGHFGLVVGSLSLRRTWPTVHDWVRWREGSGPHPLLDPELEDLEELEPEDAPYFDELDVHLFVDALRDGASSIMHRLESFARDAGDVANTLRHQLPMVAELERLGPERAVGFGRLLAERAESEPEATFFLHRDRAYSYAQVNARVEAVVRGLWSVGVRAGDHVGVVMGRRPSALSIVAALSRLGAVGVLVPEDASAEDVREALAIGEATHLVADEPNLARAREAFAGPVYCLGGGGRARTLEVEDVVDLEAIDVATVSLPADAPLDESRGRDLAFVLFSVERGPRGLRAAHITNGRWALAAYGAAAACSLSAADTVYSALPLHHASGILVTVGGAIAGGARLALAEHPLAPRLDAPVDRFWEEIRRVGATVVFYAGAMARPLVLAPPRRGDESTPVRIFAGSGMRPDTWKKLSSRFGVQVVEFYATTVAPVVFANLDGRKIGSVGRAMPGSAASALVCWDFLADAPRCVEGGRLRRAPDGEAGMLLVAAGEATYGSEEGDDPVLHDVFREGDAWRVTGDVLVRDGGADYAFLGRSRDVVVTDEGTIFPRSVEASLEGLPAASFVVAFAHRDAGSGQCWSVALLAQRPGEEVHVDEIEAALRHVPPGQRPHAIHRVEGLPLTEGFRPRLWDFRDADLAGRDDVLWRGPDGRYRPREYGATSE